MHYPCMVVGPDPEQQLEPYFEELRVPRYKQFLDERETKLMAEHFSLPEHDLQALAAKMPAWDEAEGGLEDGRLFRWSTANPNSKYDWHEVGGRFDGFLLLKQPLQPTGFRKLLGAKQRERANQARKSDIQQAPLLADPPTALLHNGTWDECPMAEEAGVLDAWRRRFAERFALVADDALLTIMDLHS